MASSSPETERLCRALLDNGPFGALLLSAEARFLAANRTYCRMVGQTEEQLLGRDVFSILPPDRRESFRAQWEALLTRPGGVATFEICLPAVDGPRWHECEAINLLDDPRVGGVLGSCKDVTARKRIETAAHETQARLNFLLSATDAVTYSARPDDYGATFISERVSEMVGWTAKEFLENASLWVDNIHPEDRDAIFATIPQLFEHGHHSFEYRFRHKDGAYRWMHDSARVVKDERGKPVEIIGYWVDISAKKETELALKRSEETFRTLVENLPTAALINRGMKILYGNPAMLRMLGYSTLDEFRATDMLSMIHPDDHAKILRRIEQMTAGASSPPLERTAIRKDGSSLVVEGEGFPLPIDGEMAYVVLFRDVSERREMLARMAVADRMVSVGMLAAGVAHELNTPLAYVSANLSMLAESMPQLLTRQSSRVPKEQVTAMLKDCQDGLERMVGVVRDLRTLSQADDGKRTRVDLRKTIEAALKMARNDIRHRARVEERYEGELFVSASEGRLVQLFLNLLMNAAQAIPEGAIDRHLIRVSAVRRDGEVVIEIADTGEGIEAEQLPRIFDPFYTTKTGLGTGLGLPICRGIVRTYGGEISISSKLNEGTQVTVRFPAAGEATRASRDETAKRERARAGRVLVLDDEIRFGKTLQLLLAPHEVIALADPREALDRIRAGEDFDVVLCDLMIPAMNGMEFYSELLRLDPAATRRIVFLTGGAFTQRSKEFLGSVPNPCLEKPASERALREAIDAIITGRAGAS